MNVEHGLDVVAEAAVTYGAFRLQVAEWAGKDPAAVTVEDIRAYEAVQEGK
ncbi:hypothetical protein [Nocardia cyriacigeorgica]|uniref:hypothetical protein n=1 Tax=Nocardia cyriacigeorgica TaxID=135487 RepID=UPI002458AF1A|nr:hypothetical protein [Nocardia cyriacigeorgica]